MNTGKMKRLAHEVIQEVSILDKNSSESDEISVEHNYQNRRHSVTTDSVKTFEELLEICGEAGWWQFRIFLLVSFCGFLTALHNLAYAFIGAVPNYWCKIPSVEGLSDAEVQHLLIPLDNTGRYSQCFRYDLPWDNNGVPWTNETLPPIDHSRNIACSDMEYDQDVFKSTIVTEFNLVCGSQPLASAVQAIFMIGILVGSPIFGSISDNIGRRRTIFVSSLIFVLAGPLVALAPNFYFLMLARFILGAATPGIYGTSFVLGYMALPGFAYFFRDWRTLQLVLSVPSLLQIFACWFTPESPRWLLRKGKVAEAEQSLRRAASVNGRSSLPENFDKLVQNVGGKELEEPVAERSCGQRIKSSVRGHAQLFLTPRLRTRTLVLYICWLSISMVYYGVALNSPNLSADRYIYTFLSGVLEIPSYFMVPPLIKFLGRRIVFSAFLLLCGISLLLSLIFSQGSALIIALALFGKLLIGGAYALIYLYATEIIPTLLRTFGVGSASMVGRIGSASAPFIVDLLGSNNKILPTMIFGIVSLVAGCLALFLPETRNKRLPETVEDVEENRS